MSSAVTLWVPIRRSSLLILSLHFLQVDLEDLAGSAVYVAIRCCCLYTVEYTIVQILKLIIVFKQVYWYTSVYISIRSSIRFSCTQ
jgi:hypothetical protein